MSRKMRFNEPQETTETSLISWYLLSRIDDRHQLKKEGSTGNPPPNPGAIVNIIKGPPTISRHVKDVITITSVIYGP